MLKRRLFRKIRRFILTGLHVLIFSEAFELTGRRERTVKSGFYFQRKNDCTLKYSISTPIKAKRTKRPIDIYRQLFKGDIFIKPSVIAITSPTMGNHAKNPATALYLSTFALIFSIFSRLTLKSFSIHSIFPSQPSPKEVIPPMLLPNPARKTHNHTLFP